MPHADVISLTLPVLLVLAGALACIGAEPFLGERRKHDALPWVAALALLAAGAALACATPGHLHGVFAMDGARRWLGAAVVASALVAVGGLQQSLGRDRFAGGEPYGLALIGAAGALLMVMSNDLIALFVALETTSLAVYCLVGLRRQRSDSNEALLKYFVMGAVFGAVFVYGLALTYGATGTTRLGAAALAGREQLWLMGQALVMVALLFKVGVVPFHFWSPDAYTGAPAAVTGFMGAVIKVAGCAALGAGGLHRVAARAGVFPGGQGGVLALDAAVIVTPAAAKGLLVFTTLFLLLALMSILIGNFSALRQTSARRLVAFSSVAQAGYMLLALVLPLSSLDETFSLGALWLYVVGYAVATAGAMTAIAAMAGREDGDDTLAGLAGQGRASPFHGAVLTVFVASFAGLPPTVGFLGKFLVFGDLVGKGHVLVAVIAMVMAVVAAGYYLKLLVAVWSGQPKESAVEGPDLLGRWALAGAAAVTVLLMLCPDLISRPVAPAAPTAIVAR
jgi:NADH-quinone oxidoreductase subunit N